MLKQKLQADQIVAQKAKKQVLLDTIRYIISQINNKEIATQKPLTDGEITGVILKIKKELGESIDAFVKGNRPELAAEYKAQLDIVAAYLPPDLTDGEITKKIKELMDANKEVIAQNPKAVIGIVMKELRGKADPARIQTILKEITAS